MQRKIISTCLGPSAIGPYSQAVRAGNLIFVSGQVPLDPATGGLTGDRSVATQTRQALKNLQGVLAGAGVSLGDVVKVTIYLIDMEDFKEVNRVYGEFFGNAPPARATVAVAALPLGASIEIDCIASKP